LRSVTIGRDLLHWSKSELRASGIGGDLAAVEHLSDCFDDAMNELERAGAVLLEAQKRLLTVAVETKPAG